MESSYNKTKLEYEDIFKTLVFMIKPKKIVEFGILNGYSLNAFLQNCDSKCEIEAYDIFDDFIGNSANKDKIKKKFKEYKNLKVEYGDFYKKYLEFNDNNIDILHIDIANDGDVYKFCIDNYLCKVKKGGLIILEGGSKERDNVEWMKKYNKKSICEYLGEIDLDYIVLDKFPSIVLVKK